MAALNLDYRSNDDIDVAFDTAGRYGDLNSPIREYGVELRIADDFGIPTTLARGTVHVIPHALFRDDIPELIHDSVPDLDVIPVDITVGGGIPTKLFGDGQGLLLVENVVVEPEYRGRNLGHMIVSAAQLFLLEDGHGVTALLPRPTDGNTGGAAELRLASYWRQMGFELRGASLTMTS